MIYVIIFIIGICVGSFLNVVADRMPKGKTVIKGRSYCDICKKDLKWYDLIPVVSFFVLGGKCRYCGAKLSLFYPIVEITTGILFVLTYIFVSYQFSIINYQLVYYLFIVSCFIAIFFSDLKYGIIPDKIILLGVLINLLYLILNSQLLGINYLFSGVGAFAFFFSLFLITKGKGMGFGDVKLSFLLGLFLGFPKIVTALYLAFLTGAFVAIILILCRKKRFFKDTIPFGPFLIFGTLTALFWGDFLLQKTIEILHLY